MCVDDNESVQILVDEYEKEMNETERYVRECKDLKVLALVNNITLKHQEALQSVYDRVPDEAKNAILHAMSVSTKGRETVIERMQERMREIGAEVVYP